MSWRVPADYILPNLGSYPRPFVTTVRQGSSKGHPVPHTFHPGALATSLQNVPFSRTRTFQPFTAQNKADGEHTFSQGVSGNDGKEDFSCFHSLLLGICVLPTGDMAPYRSQILCPCCILEESTTALWSISDLALPKAIPLAGHFHVLSARLFLNSTVCDTIRGCHGHEPVFAPASLRGRSCSWMFKRAGFQACGSSSCKSTVCLPLVVVLIEALGAEKANPFTERSFWSCENNC